MAATYKGLLTNNGKALIASATLNNKINYSHIAVGDGNGSVPNPLETRTALVNEKARIALNVVEINPNNTNQIICEAIIPSNLGGFYIRELGLYAGATMVVNASYPPTYKPLADEGGAREIAIKLVLNIQNAEVIALYLDDSLIYATRAWVDTNYIRRNELVDNLTTNDSKKPLSAKQGKFLNENKLNRVLEGGDGVTDLEYAQLIAIGDDVGRVYPSGLTWFQVDRKLGLLVGMTGIPYVVKKEKNKASSIVRILTENDNAVSASKLLNPRNIFGQTFDGSSNVGGTVTVSDGLIKSDNHHYIDMGRQSFDRMSFHCYGAIFNFIDTQNGNIVARITQNGIDCNAASASKLAIPRKIGGIDFDGTADIDLPGVNRQGNQNTSGVVLTFLNNGIANAEMTTEPETAWNNSGRVTAKFTNNNNALAINVSGLNNERKVMIQSGHDTPEYAAAVGEIQLNPLGGLVTVNKSEVLTGGKGNAVSASKLLNPRNIFGQTFDGSSNVGGTVTVSDGLIKSDNYHYIDIGRNGLDRMNFYNYGAVFNFINSEDGNIVARITQNGIDCNAASASKLAAARKIGGIDFDGTADIDLPGVSTGGNQNTTGNAATATKLAIPRKINGKDFDGTADIEVIDDALQYMPVAYPKSTPPAGYLVFMGQAISQSVYPKLYALYGQYLPDLRAYSIRGLDYGRGIDTDRTILSEQQDDIKSHSHTYFRDNIGGYWASSGGSGSGQDGNTGVTGGAETRVKNIAFLYIVKAG